MKNRRRLKMADLYRKKPVVIEAFQIGDSNESILEAIKFTFGTDLETHEFRELACILARKNGGLMIDTLEGKMKADFGDYIIKGIKGEFYPCKPDIFDATYEKVEG